MMGQFTTAIYRRITGATGLQTRASETGKDTGLKTRGTRARDQYVTVCGT
jgi:hypothetical protein